MFLFCIIALLHWLGPIEIIQLPNNRGMNKYNYYLHPQIWYQYIK